MNSQSLFGFAQFMLIPKNYVVRLPRRIEHKAHSPEFIDLRNRN